MNDTGNIQEKQITPDELEFAIFCIENLGKYLNKSAKEVYRLLTEHDDILDNYIIYGYEALHTQGKEYIMEDIADIMQRKGIGSESV